MKAYKATYNFKCGKQEYKVGKTYTADKMEICECGIHFCLKMEDVLNYYDPKKDFILLEIEVLGKTVFVGNKGVTDKIKVLRVVPPEEYSEKMKHELSRFEYDSNGNITSVKYLSGNVYRYEYDSNGNKISFTGPDGNVTRYEYNANGKIVTVTYPSRGIVQFGYDSNGNRISETLPNGEIIRYEYDSNDNVTSKTYPGGNVRLFEYDSNGNMISDTWPDGTVTRYEVATITESDS